LAVVRYRVEQVAAACDVSVDTVRYYQSRGLLPLPAREGRVAWYGPEHAERIRDIRSLQRKGLTLAAIKRALDAGPGRADADLATAVASARGEGPSEELLTLEEFSLRSGVPASLIQAVEREGIRFGVTQDGDTRYTSADIEAVRNALRLLEFGLPLGELLALARAANDAMRSLAERAIDLFDEHVRKPVRDTAVSEEDAAAQIVQAFDTLLPVVTTLVATHFRRVLLAMAEDRLS